MDLRAGRTFQARFFVVALAGWMLIGIGGFARNLHVPQRFETIQAAVDAALPGDVVLIAPGTYYGALVIENKEDLSIRGDVEIVLSDDALCWETIREPALSIMLVGSLEILSSRQISIETITVTGPGSGIFIDGTPSDYTSDVSIRYCNLLYNHGCAVELGDHYRRLAVTCCNAAMNVGADCQILSSTVFKHHDDVMVTCTLSFFDTEIERPDVRPGDVIVAVIDSGIDNTLPALSCRMWRNPGEVAGNGIDDDENGYVDDVHGWDFRDDDADSLVGSPLHWHGTFVAGLLANSFEAKCPPSLGCELWIMDLRFLDEDGYFYTSDWFRLIEAIEYAVANGARIINFSIYATEEPPPEVRETFRRAIDQGVVIVAIAGNDAAGLGPIANWEEVITVGAVSRDREPAPFSNVGPAVDLSAHGIDVLSFLPGGGMAMMSGTSFAAPSVAGLIAFHISQSPQLTPEEVEAILSAAAVDVGEPGKDPETGEGAIE